MQVRVEPAGARFKHSVKAVYLDGEKLKFIGSSSRTIWGNADVVVKLEMPGRNMLQTAGEVSMWDMLEGTEDALYFAPVIDHGVCENAMNTFFLVQLRVNGRRASSLDGPTVSRAYELARRYNMECDFGRHQYFIVGDTPIIHDYGYLDDGGWMIPHSLREKYSVDGDGDSWGYDSKRSNEFGSGDECTPSTTPYSSSSDWSSSGGTASPVTESNSEQQSLDLGGA